MVCISHWLPIITRCPLSIIPDFVYVTVWFKDGFHELYAVRKRIKKRIAWKRAFMEDLATELTKEFKDAWKIRVALMGKRHIVDIYPNSVEF